MSELNLLPCPFCGGALGQHDALCYFAIYAAVEQAPSGDLSLIPDLVDAWNRRATQPASAPADEPATTDQAREYLVAWHRKNLKTAPYFSNYIKTELAGDFAFHLARWLARQAVAVGAPQGQAEPVAWAVQSKKGGIHKLAITRESAERKAARWQMEWPDNGCKVRPLVYGDAAPTQPTQAVERDAARLDFVSQHQAWIAWTLDSDRCRLFHRTEDGDAEPMMGWSNPGAWCDTAREAIDAAIASMTKENES